MLGKPQRLHIDPYYCPHPFDGHDANSPLSSPSSPFSFSPPTDMSSTASRTPISAELGWRICFVLCLHDFSSTDIDHLSFRRNEILEIVKKEETGWWAALRTDRIGWVPSTFVTEITDEAAERLRNVKEELRVYEFEAERLYSAEPVTGTPHFFDTTLSPVSATGHGPGYPEDDNWYHFIEPREKAHFTRAMSTSGFIATDFPDDVAPLSGVSPSSRSHSHTDSLDKYSTDPEAEPHPGRRSSVHSIACPPSPATPMPQPLQSSIAPLLINKPTPPTPASPMYPSPVLASPRSTLNRARSDSAPSLDRSTRRRPIMVNDFSSLSKIYMLLDSPHENAASIAAEELQTTLESVRTSPTIRRSDKVLQLTGDDDAQAFHNAKVAQASLPWYLKPSYSSDEIKLEYDGSVRAGTLSALVERLTVDPLKMAREKMYRDAFLTTFITFTTAREFFDLLIERFEMDYPPSLTQEESNEWREKKLRPVQKRVLTILSMWLENHGLLQDDPHIAPRMKDFLSSIVSPPTLALSARLLLQSLDKMATAAAHPLPPIPTPPKRRKPNRLLKNDLLRIDPVDLASQLTLYEHRLYAKIRPRECLRWAKTQAGENVANLAAFCATHDRVAAWVKAGVLANEGLGKRADTVDFWIKVAEKCRALNNFSSMSAIVAALSSTVITRLHLTWAHVKRGSHLEIFTRLNEPSGNFSAYRAALQAVDGPCIPFIGVFLTDIAHIQDQLKDIVTFPLSPYACSASPSSASSPKSIASPASNFSPPASSSHSTGPPPTGPPLINFVKRQKWTDAVSAVVRFQGKVPAIVENAPLMTFVSEQLTLSAEKLKDPMTFWVRSQELQQSEVAHADIRRGLEAAGF
ncbi:hypothetical protein M0805_002418 [Coniferiporia weirii]|nr:hypothetical protein M0805_002418 [Coniferiporia weirii]